MAPRPTRDSIIPITDGADLHADPRSDPGPDNGFLPPLESGPVVTAQRPLDDLVDSRVE